MLSETKTYIYTITAEISVDKLKNNGFESTDEMIKAIKENDTNIFDCSYGEIDTAGADCKLTNDANAILIKNMHIRCNTSYDIGRQPDPNDLFNKINWPGHIKITHFDIIDIKPCNIVAHI